MSQMKRSLFRLVSYKYFKIHSFKFSWNHYFSDVYERNNYCNCCKSDLYESRFRCTKVYFSVEPFCLSLLFSREDMQMYLKDFL